MTGVIKPDKVVQFRAVPFAKIPARFKQSILLETLRDTDGNFTQRGYACPQMLGDPSFGGGAVPGDVYPHPTDEFKCLILQLNVPLACLQSTSDSPSLPVLVYIHGGGFATGMINEAHNTALMVEQSILDSQPIISASIQYRLGALGYLHVPEPGNANLALKDQQNALVWIQRFIGSFGGDPGKVTVFGESAGGISICAHMMSHPPPSGPLFQRAIVMSGVTGPMTAPITYEEADKHYEAFLAKLDIGERGETGLQKLREVHVQKIVEASTEFTNDGGMWLSVRDQEWFQPKRWEASTPDPSRTIEWQEYWSKVVPPNIATWNKVPELIGQCKWVKDIILGTTSLEGTTLMGMLDGVTAETFLAGIEAQLGPKSAELVSYAYKITPAMDQNLFTSRAGRWIGDVAFDAPTYNLAKYLTTHATWTSWNQLYHTRANMSVYRYIFHVRNPFPGSPCYQQPHHWVDKYFVFKNHQFRYPTQKLKDMSTQHAQLWIDFANGKKPWKEYKYTGDGDEVIMVADERDGWVERTVGEHEKIMETTWRTCEALLESWKQRRDKPFSPFAIEPLEGKKRV